jgi:hypothetical protein
LAFAAWESAVMTRTPEANIRVDLLVIWPALLAASGWALWRTLRRGPAPGAASDPSIP